MSDTSAPAYQRILLKLSGEALRSPGSMDNISPEIVARIAEEIAQAHRAGVQIGLVVGGGNFWRGAKASVRGMDRATADYVGMLATVMNALAVCDRMEQLGILAKVMTSVDMKTFADMYTRRDAVRELESGKVVIFGGGTGNPYFSTDTAAALRACEIGADALLLAKNVDGVYSADPRVVKNARKMKEITYNEMLEMARLGAGVMQPRSVELGSRYGVPIHVRSTFTAEPGTIIREGYTVEEKEFVVRGVTHDLNVAKVAVLGVPDRPGIAFKIFSALADANIDVDMIVQSIRNADKKINDIVFTVAKGDVEQTRTIMASVGKELDVLGVVVDEAVAKVSIVGAGMLGSPGMAARMFGALSAAGINIEVISTSEISVSCLVREERAKDAVNAIHAAFFRDDKSRL